MFENRKFLVIPKEMVDEVDFNQVLQTSKDTLRYSVDGTKTFVKYEITEVLEDITNTYINPETGEETTTVTKAGIYGRPSIWSEEMIEYTHPEMLELLATEEWTKSTIIE